MKYSENKREFEQVQYVFKIYFIHLTVLSTQMSMCVWCPWRLSESTGSPRMDSMNVVNDHVGVGNQTCVLCKANKYLSH